ncbi:hypothetical protein ETU10_01645 [Apibacter muscae]|uniref:hypothetical protein n=1 Tax=Apibacter muscae TaxID=2509004 RepID=UPI0011AD4758|nr:hypothetical protein [Apibacter muscae]TWP24688.1 hypothetical protein ETU10_01645 [Apibacter muscae]
MGTSYLSKDEVFAVCTYQLGADPKKFSHSRDKPSVFHGKSSGEKVLLTIQDRNLNEAFTCKSPWNIAASILAFGAGIIVGALVFSNPVGWIIGGALLCAYGVSKIIEASNHKCTDPLGGGKWFLVHGSVRFNGYTAVTRSSILKCGNGGVLTPFFSEATAKKAAEAIASNNRWELGLNTAASFGAGFFFPSAFASVGSATTLGGKVMAGSMITGKFAAGFVAFSAIFYAERAGIRTWNENIGDLKDNATYDAMNNYKETQVVNGKEQETNIDKNTFWPSVEKPDDVTQDISDIAKVGVDANGKYNIIYLENLIQGTKNLPHTFKDAELNRKLAKLKGKSRPVLNRDPEAQKLLEELNNGKYSKQVSDMENYNPRRINPTMVKDGAEATKARLTTTAQGVLFVMPFISTLFSEASRSDLARAAAKDLKVAGTHIVANTPID